MARMNSLFPDDLMPRNQKKKRPEGGAGRQARPPSAGGPADSRPRVPVKDLTPGQEVWGTYLVQDSSLRLAKNGSKYVTATFMDKTGTVPVRHWDASEKDFEAYKQGGYVMVRGRVETYQNRIQMIAMRAEATSASSVDAAEFLDVGTGYPVDGQDGAARRNTH